MNSPKENAWAPCYADPERGVAFFDGITIEADPLTSSRWDRVLPVFEEEQIFVCRQLSERLKEHPGSLVLDIGTGNGVYAIWAATHGCRVVAIDCSSRAIWMARQNAVRNGIEVVDSFNELKEGAILLVEQGLKDFASSWAKEKFGFVLLSSPYTPTCKGFYPAQYAAADQDGQGVFKDWIKNVPSLLEYNGFCVGHQMSLATTERYPRIFDWFKSAFSNQCEIRHTRMIGENKVGDDIEIGDFLRNLYQNLPQITQLPDETDVETYVRSVEKAAVPDSHFALLYFEIKKTATNQATNCTEFEAVRPTNKTWELRANAHRHVFNHHASLNSFPSPSLFLHDAVFSERLLPKETSNRDISEKWQQSILSYVDSWLNQYSLLNEGVNSLSNTDCSFDTIVVDTTPWYQNFDGVIGLPQEISVWTSPKYQEYTSDLMAQYHATVRSMLNSKTGLFLHPHLTGKNFPGRWRDMHSSMLHGEAPIPLASTEEKSLLNSIGQKYQRCYDDLNISTSSRWLQELEEEGYLFSLSEGQAYSWTKIEPLNLEEAVLYSRTMFEERIFELNPELKSDFDYEQKLRDKSNFDSEDVARDMELCHLFYHDQLREAVKSTVGATARWSTLFVIPLTLSPAPETSEASDVPEAYRGGIWVFACSSQPLTLCHERKLEDLSKLLWLLYNKEYSLEATRQISRMERSHGASIAGHEGGAQLSTMKNLVRILANPIDMDSTLLAEMIMSSIDYVRLFLVDKPSSADELLPKQNEAVHSWMLRCFEAAWRIAVLRQNKNSDKASIAKCMDTFESVRPMLESVDENSSNMIHGLSEGINKDYPSLRWDLTRWLLAALSNAIRWSAKSQEWMETSDFAPILYRISSEQGGTTIEIFNGCAGEDMDLEVADQVEQISSLKKTGTKRVLDSIATRLPQPCIVQFGWMDQEERERWLPEKLDCGFKTTLSLPHELFALESNREKTS